ncbi:MAG: carboxypeptidase-like regulatory domain-containing protein, partial [Duncaniella sp.]|nr:carboxypeptidase-like regulatory domain-containing protein [Duncaniella sp.]
MNDVKSLFSSVLKGQVFRGGKKLIASLITLLLPAIIFAQDITVKGTVVDDTGEPVIGATVLIDGTSQGTATDFDGNFTLKVPEGAKLKISYIGYDTQVVPAKD